VSNNLSSTNNNVNNNRSKNKNKLVLYYQFAETTAITPITDTTGTQQRYSNPCP
jgi:hypothetical protein